MSFTANRAWFFFSLLKISYMLVAVFILSNYIPLGDTKAYIEGVHSNVGRENWLLSSTMMMDFFASSFNKLLGSTLANLPFVLLSIYGLYYAISRITLTKKQLILLLALLSLPSFGVWTSIASKEAVSVFYLGIILGFIIDLIKNNPKKKKIYYWCVLHFIYVLYLNLST